MATFILPPELKERFLDALRSGEYKQTTGQLHRLVIDEESGEKIEEFCVMGVYADCIDPELWEDTQEGWISVGDHKKAKAKEIFGSTGQLPTLEGGEHSDSPVAFPRDLQSRLIEMNDRGLSFAEIADYIESVA